MARQIIDIKVKHVSEGHHIKLDVTYEAFAQIMGYASEAEVLEAHESIELALDHWMDKWKDMGLKVKFIP
jgi:hypothetical protein